jgi:hypothetical protein
LRPASGGVTLAHVRMHAAETNPPISRMGRTTLERILADSRTMDE